MLKIKLKGLDMITFNQKLIVNGNIPGYTIEHQILEGKLCESSKAIYPTAKYKSEIDKFTAIQTELSCNQDKIVALESTEALIEYIDVNVEIFTLRELYEKYKTTGKRLYECEYTMIKATKEQLQNIVKCNSEFGCDYCRYKQGSYYTFDLNENKVRLEALGEGVVKDKHIELKIFIATKKMMNEIEEYEKTKHEKEILL